MKSSSFGTDEILGKSRTEVVNPIVSQEFEHQDFVSLEVIINSSDVAISVTANLITKASSAFKPCSQPSLAELSAEIFKSYVSPSYSQRSFQ